MIVLLQQHFFLTQVKLIIDVKNKIAFLTLIMNSGPFNSDYRRLLVLETWMPMIVKLQIPISPTFDFSLFLAEPTDVREWNLKGLPSDAFSVENGVLVTRGRRWPLMVDPQVIRNIVNNKRLVKKSE